MKKIVSNALYVLFFGFALTLVIACVLLIINISKGEGQTLNDIEAVQISGSAEDSAAYETIGKKVEVSSSPGYQNIPSSYGYDALETDKKKFLYDRLFESIYSVSDEPDENGRYRISRVSVPNKRLSEFDIREVVNAFIYDNPEIFWLENLFGYAYLEDDTIVEFYSILSAEECHQCISRFNTRIDEILSQVGENKTEYQREKIIHDIVLGNCVYKTGVKSSDDGWEYFTAYGALVNGEAVCEGYAKSMQLLLNRVGVACSMIRGDAGDVPHMWNVVELGGEWYHLDPTWDDMENEINYEYFNLTTLAISENHTICDSVINVIESQESGEIDPLVKYNFYVPMCTSKDMNYYYAEGVYIKDFKDSTNEALIDAIMQRAVSGDVYIPVRFGEDMPYSDYVSCMFEQSPYQFYLCLEEANKRLDKEQRLPEGLEIKLLKKEANKTLRIRLLIEKENAG